MPSPPHLLQWGEVTATGLSYGTLTLTVPPELLTAPEPPASKTKALVAGIVGGVGGGLLALGLLAWVIKARRARAARREGGSATHTAAHAFLESGPSAPGSPAAFLPQGAPFSSPVRH